MIDPRHFQFDSEKYDISAILPEVTYKDVDEYINAFRPIELTESEKEQCRRYIAYIRLRVRQYLKKEE